MKRKIYKNKQIWKSFFTALLLAVVFALLGENFLSQEVKLGVWYPEELRQLGEKTGFWASPSGDLFSRVNPTSEIKFIEMLIFMTLWFLLMNFIFQTGKNKVVRIFQSAVISFGYGAVMTFVWFLLGRRMEQLSIDFLGYVGAAFAVWCTTMAIGCLLTERTVKSPTLSMSMTLLNIFFKKFSYMIVPFWYFSYYSSILAYYYNWRMIFRNLGSWTVRMLPVAVVGLIFIALMIAYMLMKFYQKLLSVTSEDEKTLYEASECERLILFVTPEDALEIPNIRMEWMRFLLVNGEASLRTRNMTAFLHGKNFVASIQQYATGQISSEKFKEKICLLWRTERKTLSMTSRQEKRVEEFLAKYEEAGFHIMICEEISQLEKTMEQKLPESVLYGRYPLNMVTEMSIPYRFIEQYQGQKNVRALYLEMHSYLQFYEEDFVLKNSIEKLCLGESTVAQFYNLLKMAEYCIHVRGLYSLSAKKIFMADLEKLSLGKWNALQRISKCKIDDCDLAEQMRWLDMLLTGKNKSDIKTTSVSYNKICDMIAELRNRFVGHGTMVYSVDEKLLYPVAAAVYQILRVYMENPHSLEEREIVLQEQNISPILAVYRKEGEGYLFSGLDEYENRDYLSYGTGAIVTLSRNGEDEFARVEITTCSDRDCSRMLFSDTREKQLTMEQKNKKREFLNTYRKVPIWAVFALGNAFEQYEKDISSGYMGKAYFETEYAEKILNEKATPQLYHSFLMELEASRMIEVYDAKAWDQIKKEWQREESFEAANVNKILMEGGFLPNVPNRIGVLGKTEKEVLNPYPWIRSLDVQQFETYPALMSWAVNASAERKKLSRRNRKQLKEQSQYIERTVTYKNVLKEIGCDSLLLTSNIYISGFFKNVLEYEDITTSTMALFDFIEFMMQCVQYTLMELNCIPPSDETVSLNLEAMGNQILCYAPEDSVLYERVNYGYIKIPEKCMELHEKMKDYLPYSFSGDRMSFSGLVKILRLLRNGTKAHGVIREEHVGVMWSLLLYYALMLGVFLDINNYELYVYGNQISAGYTGTYKDCYIYMKEYFAIDKNVPCPLWQLKDEKKKYTNYFYGHYVIPDYVEK